MIPATMIRPWTRSPPPLSNRGQAHSLPARAWCCAHDDIGGIRPVLSDAGSNRRATAVAGFVDAARETAWFFHPLSLCPAPGDPWRKAGLPASRTTFRGERREV